MEAACVEDCCVKVAVHIRPLIGDEKLQDCKDCVFLVPGKPQVQIGSHSFTFDHVYGSSGSPSVTMFEECVAPLVDGLFQGYNATVLAYGQTGSGKTYTMGTGFKDGVQTGLVLQVMNTLFNKIETLNYQSEFQLHVSFIEIHKEEVIDLLDPDSTSKSETTNGHTGKVASPRKPPIQIRETSNGVITLAGSTERSVKTLKEMADCLHQGSLNRATGSTNMNNQSSRSHAIFTITLKQMRKLNPMDSNDGHNSEFMTEEYLCAKLHLVDLAGSERAKRTGSDGLRFKEGVHINKGLLALGNVISALGDEKKQREGAHVPYRDSKLTRLLQDSLGGNSRTFMIACISPADINAEETLNTLKYANRARNIQNKPVINRDPMSNEMLKMRQQLEYLQAELCARNGGAFSDEIQLLKDKIAWLEATNEELSRELNEYRRRGSSTEQYETEVKVCGAIPVKNEGLKRGLQSMDSSGYPVKENGDPGDMEEEVAKEWEHTLLQDFLDKELNELNKRLEQKEVLQRKTEEAATATKRLKELLEARKSSARENSATGKANGTNGQSYEKSLQRWLDHELEIMVNVYEVQHEYEKQSQVRAALEEELAVLRQVNEFASKGLISPKGKKGLSRALSMSPNARMARIASLGNMLSISSSSLVAMPSQLSEAEERDRAFSNRGRWNQLRSMGDAKNLLQYMFSSLADARCQHWEKELEIKEMKEQMRELIGVLRQSEIRRKEIEKDLKVREKPVTISLASSASAYPDKHFVDDTSGPLSPVPVRAQKQLKYSAGIASASFREAATFIDQTRKMVPLGQLSMKKMKAAGQGGKLWRCKRSHHRWILQFKWKWQKPWRLSEWIRHDNETMMRARHRKRVLPSH